MAKAKQTESTPRSALVGIYLPSGGALVLVTRHGPTRASAIPVRIHEFPGGSALLSWPMEGVAATAESGSRDDWHTRWSRELQRQTRAQLVGVWNAPEGAGGDWWKAADVRKTLVPGWPAPPAGCIACASKARKIVKLTNEIGKLKEAKTQARTPGKRK